MSVIAVDGVSLSITLNQVAKLLSKSIEGNFNPINFLSADGNNTKTCYVQLSEDVDPAKAIDSINHIVLGKKKNVFKAYIPDSIPKLPPKPVFIHKIMRKKLGIPAGELKPEQVLSVAHLEIMTELQFKYPLLCGLSLKSSHKLLEGIGMTVQERLEKIMLVEGDHGYDPRLLTERYRKMHPHFGDFELIRNTLHGQQAAAGEPLKDLKKSQLTQTVRDWQQKIYSKSCSAGSVDTLTKYNKRITKKLEQYVQNYDLTPHPHDSRAERARKEVRRELAQMMTHLPAILYELKMKHFPKTRPMDKYEKIRMYGEPCLPPEEITQSLFQRFKAVRVSRRKTMYNMIAFDVPVKTAPKVLELDGTYWGGSKLVIRPIYINSHKVTIKDKNAATKSAQIDVKEEETSSTAQ